MKTRRLFVEPFSESHLNTSVPTILKAWSYIIEPGAIQLFTVEEMAEQTDACILAIMKQKEYLERVTALEGALAQAVDELTKVHRYFNAKDGFNAVNPDGAELSARGAVRDSVFKELEDILHKKQPTMEKEREASEFEELVQELTKKWGEPSSDELEVVRRFFEAGRILGMNEAAKIAETFPTTYAFDSLIPRLYCEGVANKIVASI